MKIFTLVFAFVVICLSFHSNFAQTFEQFVIKTSKNLEEKPFDKETLKMRKESMKWINQNRKFHLSCSVSGDYLPSSYKFRGDLFAVFIIGTVVFYLENPDKCEDDNNAKNGDLVS